MKILITGISGTGKSTIGKALKEKGYSALDFNEIPGLCSWQNKTTREKVNFPENPELAWFDENGRYCDVQKLKDFLNGRGDVIMTGVASGNQAEYFDLFDTVFLLQCSPEVFVRRMQERPTTWDKNSAAQDQAVAWQKDFDPMLVSQGAIPIQNDGDIDKAVEAILDSIKA